MTNALIISDNLSTIINTRNPARVVTVSKSNITAGAVTSVNTQTGAVVLDADDISDTTTTNKFATAAELAQIATNQTNIGNNTSAIALKQDDLDLVSQADAEAGTSTVEKVWTAQRVSQAIAALVTHPVVFLDSEFKLQDNTSGFQTSFNLDGLTANRVMTMPDFAFDFSDYFESSGKELTLGTEGVKIREETGFGYTEFVTNGTLRILAQTGFNWSTSGGATLRGYTWSGTLQKVVLGFNHSFSFDSDIVDSSVYDSGFTVNNKNVTTKHIQEWQSAGVQKAYIDKAGILNTPSVQTATRTETADYTIDATTGRTIRQTTAGTTMTAPTAIGIAGQSFRVKNASTGDIYLDSTLSQTFDGDLTWTIASGDWIDFEADDTGNYMVTG